MSESLDDYRWLVSEAAERWLEAAASVEPLHVRVRCLRRELSSPRAHLVLEQVELRRRARGKFRQAERMFFTPRSLEQATEESIAVYKASRLGVGLRVADFCCGIGGDAIGLGQHHSVVGVEQDALVACLAEANMRAWDLSENRIEIADVNRFELRDFDALHLDPDRRAGDRRAVHAEIFTPNADDVLKLLRSIKRSVVKLAPATPLPMSWEPLETAREWIGSRGECRQQLLWHGGDLVANERRATLLGDGQAPLMSFAGDPDIPPMRADRAARFVFEPHAAVLAAGLAAALAEETQLAALGVNGYLTGDNLVSCPALTAFRVEEVMPFDRKRLRSYLRERNYGPLEIKKRGVDTEPRELRQWLKLRGDRPGVLLLLQQDGRRYAVVAERMTANG